MALSRSRRHLVVVTKTQTGSHEGQWRHGTQTVMESRGRRRASNRPSLLAAGVQSGTGRDGDRRSPSSLAFRWRRLVRIGWSQPGGSARDSVNVSSGTRCSFVATVSQLSPHDVIVMGAAAIGARKQGGLRQGMRRQSY